MDSPLRATGGLEKSCSPLRYAPRQADPDYLIDLRAVYQMPHRELSLATMPALLLPCKGRYGLTDYEKIYCADQRRGLDIFDLRGIDRRRGFLAVVRPD